MSSKPSIVIVPGAWQKPAAFDQLAQLLRTAGYPTTVVSLPTVGGPSSASCSDKDLGDDIAAVRAAVHEALRLAGDGANAQDVVLMGYSSGGLSMSGAVQGLDTASRRAAGESGGVARCVFMTAFVVPAGTSALQMLGGKPLPWMQVAEDKTTTVAPEAMIAIGFSDLPPAEQARWAAEMTHTSLALFASAAVYEPWRHGIPCSYVFCTEDRALPYAMQAAMAHQLGPEARTATLTAGHCPHLSVPGELLRAIESVI